MSAHPKTAATAKILDTSEQYEPCVAEHPTGEVRIAYGEIGVWLWPDMTKRGDSRGRRSEERRIACGSRSSPDWDRGIFLPDSECDHAPAHSSSRRRHPSCDRFVHANKDGYDVSGSSAITGYIDLVLYVLETLCNSANQFDCQSHSLRSRFLARSRLPRRARLPNRQSRSCRKPTSTSFPASRLRRTHAIRQVGRLVGAIEVPALSKLERRSNSIPAQYASPHALKIAC